MSHTYAEAAQVLHRITKTNHAWHTRESETPADTFAVGMSAEHRRKDEERDQDIIEINTTMGLLAKHLTKAGAEKVNAVDSQRKASSNNGGESEPEEEANYLNDQGAGLRTNTQGSNQDSWHQGRELRSKLL